MAWTQPSSRAGGTLITAAEWNRTTYQFGDPMPTPQQFASYNDFTDAYRLWHRAQRTGAGDPVGALVRAEVVRIRKDLGLS